MPRRASLPGARAGSTAAGRPRSAAVDAAILRAATELLVQGGVGATTINAVARRSGVARASIYLRYPGRDALVTAAIRAAIGRDPIPVTGDIVRDLHRGAEQTRAILASKPFRAVLPRLIEGLLRPRGRPGAITYAMLAPNRQLIVDEYRALAGQAGLRSEFDADLVVDLLIGGLLNRLLVTGVPPTHADAEHTVEVLLAGLSAR